MKYDFDEIIPRRHTNSYKWDSATDSDVLPLWVADMDFACAPCVVEAVQKRAAHPVYGYGMRQQPYYDAVMGWLKKRHGFEVKYEHLAFAPPGVIYALNVMLRILTKPGDRVMVPMPNYDPLFDMVTRGGRKLVETPLVWKDGRYTFDFADMEAKAASGVKVLVLSSPHNPTGRVWTRQELEGVAEICLRHNIFMLVDEIHCDFVPPEHPHTTFGLLGEEVLRHSMVCYSSNKGFNLGGLGMATLVLADDDLRCKFNEEMSIAQTRLDNIFGMAALIAAYNDGEEWLDQAIAYVSDNKAYLDQFLRERIPQIRMIPSEGTYLVWLDCSQLPYRGMALEHFMINEAKVAFCAGYEFGKQGEAFLRMNVACPRCTLTKALEQMEKALQNTTQILEETNQIDWTGILNLIHLTDMEKMLVEQYKNGENLNIRISLHEQYSQNKKGWFPWLLEQMDFDGARRILEIGCGNGQLWKKAEPSVLKGKYICLSDLSDGMIRDAAENLGEEKAFCFDFRTLDCQKLPFPDAEYDRIIANHVLFYVQNLSRGLQEISRVLSDDGVFYCSTYGKGHMKEITDLVQEFDPQINLSEVALYTIFGLDHGEKQLKPYFGSVEKRIYEDSLWVDRPEPLLDYILSCHGNQNEYLYPRQREFKEFLEKKIQKHGGIAITKEAGVFICRK